jgi:hypothetical protein
LSTRRAEAPVSKEPITESVLDFGLTSSQLAAETAVESLRDCHSKSAPDFRFFFAKQKSIASLGRIRDQLYSCKMAVIKPEFGS